MAQGTGELELLLAISQVQLDNEALAEAGVFTVSAPRADALPYFLNAIQKPSTPRRRLSGRVSSRHLQVQMKAVAKEDGREAIEIAGELANINYALFGDPATSRARLNEKLEPLGWSADMPLEEHAVGPYKDNIDDLERWHVGHLFTFNIKPLPTPQTP